MLKETVPSTTACLAGLILVLIVLAAVRSARRSGARETLEWPRDDPKGERASTLQMQLDRKATRALESMKPVLESLDPAVIESGFYGAVALGGHLVVWFFFATDDELDRARAAGLENLLASELRARLVSEAFPSDAMERLLVGLVSEEDIQRRAGGNRYDYFQNCAADPEL